ncbi:putative taste receptor type 2 member 33 [Molossus nigricans]
MALLPIIISSLLMIQFVLGNFANGFIALVNCTDWVKRQKLSCTDRILTALAVSRIGLLWVLLLNWYATVFNLAFYNTEARLIMHIFWVVSNHCSLWLATSLNILYLLMIANFSNHCFLHLKWKAKRVVLMIFMGTLIFLVCHITVISAEDAMVMNVYDRNVTWETNMLDEVHISNVTVFILVNFIPFTMSLTAVLLLIFSMWKHVKKMQLNGKGSQDLSTKIHVRAMQTVISFLLLFVIFFVSQIISVWNSSTLQNISVRNFCKVLGFMYPSSHSFILIFGNKKLRQAFLSFLWQPRCWLNKRK